MCQPNCNFERYSKFKELYLGGGTIDNLVMEFFGMIFDVEE